MGGWGVILLPKYFQSNGLVRNPNRRGEGATVAFVRIIRGQRKWIRCSMLTGEEETTLFAEQIGEKDLGLFLPPPAGGDASPRRSVPSTRGAATLQAAAI